MQSPPKDARDQSPKSGAGPTGKLSVSEQIDELKKEIRGKDITQNYHSVLDKLFQLQAKQAKDFKATICFYNKGNFGYGHIAVEVDFDQYQPAEKKYINRKMYLSYGEGKDKVGALSVVPEDLRGKESRTYQILPIEIQLPVLAAGVEAEMGLEAVEKFANADMTEYSRHRKNCADEVLAFIKNARYDIPDIVKPSDSPRPTTPKQIAEMAAHIKDKQDKKERAMLFREATDAKGSDEKLTVFKKILQNEISCQDTNKCFYAISEKTEEKLATEALIKELKTALFQVEKNQPDLALQTILKGIIETKLKKPPKGLMEHFPFDALKKSLLAAQKNFLEELKSACNHRIIQTSTKLGGCPEGVENLINLLKNFQSGTASANEIQALFIDANIILNTAVNNPSRLRSEITSKFYRQWYENALGVLKSDLDEKPIESLQPAFLGK